MKKFLITAIGCAAGLLAAQELWDGTAASVKVAGSVLNPKVQVVDGKLTVSGKTAGTGRYSYLTFYIKTKPFQLNGKDLAITAAAGDVKPGDTLYIKGQTVGRKMVLSAVKWGGASTSPNEYVVRTGKNADLKWIADQITAKENEPINVLEIHFGRKGAHNDFKLTISDIKLVDRPKELTTAGSTDLGVGVASSELRNCAPGLDAKGRPFIIASPLHAHGDGSAAGRGHPGQVGSFSGNLPVESKAMLPLGDPAPLAKH